MNWLQELTGTDKAVIAMCHLQAMPGDPYYDKAKGMDYVVEMARRELHALQDGGVDAVMFSNEFSLPYLTDVRTETVAAMARIIGELKSEIKIPYGVNVLWDAKKSIDLAAATGAQFVREIFTGVYGSDFGLWNTNVGETVRHRQAVGADNVKLLFNIVPESARYMAARDIREIAVSTVFVGKPDALCVSGLTAGAPTDSQSLRIVKEAVPGTVVLANTGVNAANFQEQLSIADGAVMGTAFKADGKFENQADVSRVRSLMDRIKEFRSGLKG
ncbi:BtpA/SgcQ family protein [Paenibacillus oralis]|uniref:BtpA/SgcQ family protein n=1 Tax=Paenibacillus oralis TaxID=2490856 RepID=A0A3P3TX08_9BACL|nr:BtpA/SgcQ family protein [Paenibacillus oralis]RRJ62655.1 BtpA/SgcQ family protein [Paenibacillus oralis]